MRKNFHIYFDNNLRDVCDNLPALEEHVTYLLKIARETLDVTQKIRYLGEAGVYLRILLRLDEAESVLRETLRLVKNNQMELSFEVQQKIRLAHVLQWLKKFDESDALFSQVIEICRTQSAAAMYLSFAYQHAGKNFYDQGRFAEALDFFEQAHQLRSQECAPEDQMKSTELSIQRTHEMLKLKT